MAKNCTDIKDARRRIKKIMDDASSATPIEASGMLLRGFHDLARDASAKLYPEIIDLIKILASRFGVLPLIGDPSTVFNDKVDINKVVAEAEERIRNLSKYEETIIRRGQVKKTFLKNLFGENGSALEYFLRSAKKGFSLPNAETSYGIPGFIDVFFTARHKGRLVIQDLIETNVMDVKLELLDKVIDYLVSKNLLTADISDNQDILFEEDGTYTGILEVTTPLYQAILKVFDPLIMASGGYLDTLYREYIKGSQAAKNELEAYNAWVLLNNFDTALVLSLGDSVDITKPENFNKIGNLSYKTDIEKATNMWSFGFGDDVSDVADLVSNVTLDLIESSRRYTWRGAAINDAYISFKDFNYIIGEIKKLAFSLQKNDIVIDIDATVTDEDTGEHISKFNNLSETTKNLLKRIEQINVENGETEFGGKPTLGLVVAFLSENPTRHLHAIFDILCNTDFIDTEVLKFNDLEKNLIWSLYKEIFGQFGSNTRSLFDLHHNTEGDTIYTIITQIADSMFAEDTIQYYEDENGVMYALLLKDYAIQLLMTDLSQQILELNGYFNSQDLSLSLLDPASEEYLKAVKNKTKEKKFTEVHEIKITYGEPSEIERWGSKKNPTTVRFIKSISIPIKVGNTEIGNIKADATGATINIPANKAKDIWKSEEFKQLIADALGIDFENDVDLLAAYESTFQGATGINYVGLLQDMGSILGVSIFNQTFNNEFVPKILNSYKKSRILSNIKVLIKGQFSVTDVTPRLDPKTGLIPIIPVAGKNCKARLLDKLGQAKAIANNIFNSAQVKTGEGTALSAYCLSRLRNSYPYQLVTQNRNRWSASRTMSFVKNRNGLIKEVASSREMKSRALVKPSTDMSGVETWSFNFYNDWVASFVPKHRNASPIGEGSASFIPTVNSDKGQIDRLLCDLNAHSHIPSGKIDPETGEPIGKMYKDLTDEELILELKIEFGPFYKNVITNISKEWDRLINLLGIRIAKDPNITIVEYWEDQLNAISKYYVQKAVADSIQEPVIKLRIQNNPNIDLEYDQVVMNYLVEEYVKNTPKTLNELIEEFGDLQMLYMHIWEELYKKNYGKIISGIHETLTLYNKTHSRNPIQIAEHIHYTKGKGRLAANNTLIALWGRFSASEIEKDEYQINLLYYDRSIEKELYDLNLLLSTYVIADLSQEDIAEIRKAKPELAEKIVKAQYNIAQSSLEGHFFAKDLESTIKLLKNGCQIYLYGPKARIQEETEFLKKLDGGKWVTEDGMMAFTRVEDALTHQMIPTNSIYAINNARKNGLKIEFHPMISKLNKMDYLTTQQYVCCVGGSHYVYKGKSRANVLEEEATRWLDSNKRNVCYASTVHKFQNKVLNGAPSVYNYAIIEDIEAALYNIMGELHSHTPLDGGMMVNAFMPELENNSLGGEAAGTDKKHFATFYFEEYGAGGITKTAGFAATNERMRNSEDWRIIQENMSSRKWIKEFSGIDGDILETIDITKDYDGNDINWQDKNVFYYREQEDGTIKFYRLAKLVKTANPNEYEIWEIEIDAEGADIQVEPTLRATEVINTNWVLFNDVFGGYRSLGREVNHFGVKNPNSALVPSEHSRKLMVEAINRVGYRKTKNNAYQALNRYGEVFTAYDLEQTREEGHLDDQDDIWQPLKYSDIHFTPNIGAIKSTQMNVNPAEAMSKKMDLNIMRVKMALLGIQLDKEHHADLAELSMPTQIITACANLGFTLNKTSELYEALSNLTEIAIEDCMEGILDLLPEGEHKGLLQARIAEIIVDKLISSKDDNEALHAVMEFLEEKRKEGNKLTPEDVKGNIAWSDSTTYNKIYSDLATHLTNKAIKLKISGSLAVICPTHHLERLYGNKRLSSLMELVPGGLGEKAALVAYQNLVKTNGDETQRIYDRVRDGEKSHTELLNLASKINTQHIYNLEYINPLTGEITTKTITVNYPQLYWQIKEELTKFRKVTRSQLKGALASTSKDGTINITDVSEINVAEFFEYIKGSSTDENGQVHITSTLKKAVFEKLDKEGFTIEDLEELIAGDPVKARMFLMFHELSHKEHLDSIHYPRKDGKLDLMHPKAIEIETRATKEAWLKMLEIQQNGDRAQEYLLLVSELNSIHENVLLGRELSAYNVRFSSFTKIENGIITPSREFCMYDLDSLRLLYEVVNDIMPEKGPGIKDIQLFGKKRLTTSKGIEEFIASEPLLQALETKINKATIAYMWKNHRDILKEYERLDDVYRKAQNAARKDPANKDLATKRNEAYKAKLQYRLNFEKEFAEAKKSAIKIMLKKQLQRDLFALSGDFKGDRTIMSLGRLHEVDPESIDPIAYELIMPKIYKTVFGLKEHDDLQAILADKNFFTKRALSTLGLGIADDNLYDYQLKCFSGNHMYIVDSRKGIPSDLIPHPDFHKIPESDRTISRTNIKGEVIYSLSSDSDTVMLAPDGTEVIVTNNPKFFIKNNIFNTVTFSNSRVTEEELLNLVEELGDTTSKSGKKFKTIFSNRRGIIRPFGDLKKRNEAFNNLSENSDTDSASPELNSIIAEISEEGRKIHTSFSKSLDIIAGRVPAQSQQSFMTLRVVAFSDSDINTAYVSTFQLFIQGSDLDIDTVNLIGGGFDQDGHYVMWSPFANIESEELLKASEKLPFPTGKSTPLQYDNAKDSFFVTYDKYFGIGKLFDLQRGDTLKNEKGVPVIEIDTESPQKIKMLAEFLRDVKKHGLNLKGTYGEDGRWHYSKELDQEIYEEGLKFKLYAIFEELGIKPTQLHDIMLQLQKMVDDHNLYIKRVKGGTKELMAKNLAYSRMYEIAADPANQTEAQESIDGPTSSIKDKGGAVEVAMTNEDKYDITSNNEKLSGPDPVSKADALTVNQTGKKGVSIGAKGTQGNSSIQFALDYILNSDADDNVKKRILLPLDKKSRTYTVVINGEKVQVPRRGYFINGKWRSSIANINDKTWEETGLTAQTDPEILAMLKDLEDETGIPMNVALYTAAMLSVAVDNAKDLSLGKINAGPQTFGMYVYGLTLGMNIIELAMIMNSPLGKAIAKVLQGNAFTGKQGATSVLSAIKFLEGESIGRYLTDFDMRIDKISDSGQAGIAAFEMNGNQVKADTASKVIQYQMEDLYRLRTGKEPPYKFTDLISELLETGELATYILELRGPKTFFASAVNIIKLGGTKVYPLGMDWIASVYQLLNWLEEFNNLATIWKSDPFRASDLRTLAEGADEMKRLGTMLGSNKGVKSKIEEGQNFINTVEECIIKRKEISGQKIKPEDRIDFVLFCANPEYREKCIEAYEEVKHSVNILQVISTIPHMFSYLRTCAIPYAGFMDASSKYRSVQAMVRQGIHDKVGLATSAEKISANKGLNNEVNMVMMMQWLSDTQKKFILPAGQPYFEENTSEIKIAELDTPIALWTPEGLATFKMYMESFVIPSLKKKKLIEDNKFILKLEKFSFSLTGTKATVQAYHLSGDMMAKEGTAMDALVKEYKAAFSAIKDLPFPQGSTRTFKEGSTIGNLQDAFYLYSEYVFGGRKGPNSLMTMFDDGTSELQKEFRQAKAGMDSTRDFVLSLDQLIRSAAQVSTIYSAKYPYFYATDTERIGISLYENEEKTLTKAEKEARYEDANTLEDPELAMRNAVSKAALRSMHTESGKGDLLAQHFLYPGARVQAEERVVGEVLIQYDGKKFLGWRPSKKLLDYYSKNNSSEELMIKDADAIDSAIRAINANMGVMTEGIYYQGKRVTEIKNLDVLEAAIDMALKHSRGEC